MAENVGIEINERIPSKNNVYYRVIQQLGLGGNSVVYLALALNKEFYGVLFALKVFTKVADRDRLDKFQQENAFLKECEHPSIMKIYDNGVYTLRTPEGSKEYPFVVAEYLPDTLQDLLRTRRTIAEKLSYTLQLLSALAHLNNQNPAVIHRDIKPQNVFVKGRSCVLGDFGLMKFASDDSEEDRAVFKESAGPGMPRYYRTPDLVAYAKQEADLTTKSDVFQLGLVIAQIFTGWNPCKRASNYLDSVELEPVRDIPGVHGTQIKSLIESMLEFDPNRRPAAVDIMDIWEGVFREVVAQFDQLQGRVF